MSFMENSFAIDSNILIYLLNGSAGEKHEKANEFMNKARMNKAAIPAQCIAESYFQVLKKDSIHKEKAREILIDLKNDPEFEILEYGKRELENAMRAESYFWDKLIEQSVLENGYEVIYTENKSDFEEIEAINPVK
jgi:predicted nucleic acid-binding protein